MRSGELAAKLLIAFALLSGPATSAAQQAQPNSPPGEPPDEDAIVVTGRVDPADLPVKSKGLTEFGLITRMISSDVELFMRCADTPRPQDLRDIVDRGPADLIAERALHDFIRRNQACYVGYPSPPPTSPYFGACNAQLHPNGKICRSIYDRGAIFERTVKRLGDPVELARRLRFDPATRARFAARERRRGQQSVSADRKYFDVVSCMLQISPGTAGRLLRAPPGSAQEAAARHVMIGYARTCFGRPVNVRAEPGQFRAYTAEVMYNWLAAASGRPSLVQG
ncbi:MAG TPA: hypothetical protein VIL42_07735 [Sphingomicrobium sp.]|jgi:hypothetical protein